MSFIHPHVQTPSALNKCAVANPEAISGLDLTLLRRNSRCMGKVNTVLGATLVASGLSYNEAAADPRVGAKNGQTLRVMLHRKGVTQRNAQKQMISGLVNASVTLQIASQAGQIVRDKYASVLDQAASKFQAVVVSPDLAELKALGEAMEPHVRMAKIVHGWTDDDQAGVVTGVTDAYNETIDVDAQPQPVVESTSEPKQLTTQDSPSSSPTPS